MSATTQQPVAAPVGTPANADKPNSLLMLLEVPAVGALFLWMIVPLAMTIVYSFMRYNLVNPDISGFAGFENYQYLAEDEAFWPSIINTIILVGSVLIITIVFGTLLAVLYNRDFFGKNIATLLVIAPFFVMPTVSALIWKNFILHPDYGLIALFMQKIGLHPIAWFTDYPLFSIIIIVAWEWLPFAFLILFTSLKSLDSEQKEAAAIDGANPIQMFFYRYPAPPTRHRRGGDDRDDLPALDFCRDLHHHFRGGPGHASENLAFLVYALGIQGFNVGTGSAGGILAVILANIVAYFLVKMLAKNLKGR